MSDDQLYDVITDYIFLLSLIEENEGRADGNGLGTLIVLGAGSVGAAFLINLLLTAFILLRERRRPAFAKVCVCACACVAFVVFVCDGVMA